LEQGKLIIVSAPSGAGKSTIVDHLLKAHLNLEFSVSATSRPKRPNETDGLHYYFITPEQFRKKITENEFLEWEEVYNNQFYGTLKSEVERIRNQGKNVVFDVDVVGGLNIKNYYKDEALAIFIMPPSLNVLRDRLVRRATENPESLHKRIEKAELELSYAQKFDRIIINDQLAVALAEADRVVEEFLGIFIK
jgi:guanylate kinase